MKNTGTLNVVAQGDREIVMTRVFDAPRAMVHEAMSRPELLKRWFGPRGWSLVECDVDYRVGGGFRFVLEGPGGHRMGMRGEYVQLDPPARTVHIETFDDFPGPGAVVTTTLTEEHGRTTLTAVVQSPSREVRDFMLQSGMEHGAAEGYDRLAELLAAQAATTA